MRANKRLKDGKEHRYWSVVENRRIAGGRSVQKTLLYLGETNDRDQAAWSRAIEAIDEREQTRQIHLFPEDRTPDPLLKHPTLQLRLSHIELARPRQWGGCWLALELWHRLDLDLFWQPLLPDSQKGTPWLKVLKTLVVYRLLAPGSEWNLHCSWFDRSAMADLLHARRETRAGTAEFDFMADGFEEGNRELAWIGNRKCRGHDEFESGGAQDVNLLKFCSLGMKEINGFRGPHRRQRRGASDEGWNATTPVAGASSLFCRSQMSQILPPPHLPHVCVR